ncbi:MAG: glutathione S-transferase family protein, partial [Myxococcales bacterium]|nr:glutathione S-transferase family protein [Myxococcales bacterium]
MRLYTIPLAPNPSKLMIYLAEKGIEIEQVFVNLVKGEHRSAEHLARNPLGSLPVLELDDGGFLTESLVIMEYLEELHPEPVMIGETPAERARVRRLERIADLSVLLPIARIVHATRSPIGLPASEEAAQRARRGLPEALSVLETSLAENPFVAGPEPSIADCTLFAGLNFGRFAEGDLGVALPHMDAW